jgi:hypothetical protein
MPSVGDKAFKPQFRFRHGVRPGNADRIEAERMRVLNQRGFDLRGLAQKSRSA